MAGDQDGAAFTGQVAQEAAQPRDPLGVQAVHRLVEDQHRRVAQHRRRDAEPLPHAERETAGPPPCSRREPYLVEDLADFRLSLEPLGGQLAADDPERDDDRWLRLAYQARGTAIAGGSTFIQRNIVAERVLGMPADIRVDKDIPFNKLGKS